MDNASTETQVSHRNFTSRSDKNYVERVRYWKAQGLNQEEAEKEAANPNRKRRRLYAVKNSLSVDRPDKPVLSRQVVNLEPENLPKSLSGNPSRYLEPENLESAPCSAAACFARSCRCGFAPIDSRLEIANSTAFMKNLESGIPPYKPANPCLNLKTGNYLSTSDSQKIQQTTYSQKIQQTTYSFKVPEPRHEEVSFEIERQKWLGHMLEITPRSEIISEAKFLRTDHDEVRALAVFSPKQPVLIPHPTQAKAWQPSDTGSELENAMDQSFFWVRLILCLIGLVVCSGALIKYGAEAGGQTPEAWFWAALIVASSSILIAQPMLWGSIQSWLQKLIGFALLGIGYVTMHASIEMTKQHAVAMAVSDSEEVQEIQEKIADLSDQLKPTRAAISRLDPIQYRTMISRMQAEAKPLEDELSANRTALITARKKAARGEGAGNLGRLALVEWLRRLMLEPLNILCMHGFLESLPAAIKKLRKPKARLAQCFV